MKTVRVNASGKYDILIGQGLLSDTRILIREAIPGAGTVMLVSDDNVFALYGSKVTECLTDEGLEVISCIIPHGESSKSLGNYEALLRKMCVSHMTRKDAVIALGGGVVGDLAGFAAATYQRGLPFVQIPTTVLAAVDSSVGGKTAVNLPEGKNQVGCFYQPSLVICDIDTLSTLPEEEYGNGCAEIIKYGILDGGELFSKISEIPVKQQYEEIISRCVEIKKKYVEEDEFDTGSRMFLNLGHTIGHAVEKCSDYQIPHGQAVAMGLAAIVKAGAQKEYCDEKLADAVVELLTKYDLPVSISYPAKELADAALNDKKNISGKMRLVVPQKLGECEIVTVDARDFVCWLKAGGIE